MTVSGDTFRELMGQFATGVTVVTVSGAEPHGMTANAVSSVSLDPPLCLVCVDHETQLYERLDGGTDHFCVNILSASQQDLGEHFAGMAQLDVSPFETHASQTTDEGDAIFDDSLAYLACSTEAMHPAGDHDIVVGRVTDGEMLDASATPLLFFQGEWATLPD